MLNIIRVVDRQEGKNTTLEEAACNEMNFYFDRELKGFKL